MQSDTERLALLQAALSEHERLLAENARLVEELQSANTQLVAANVRALEFAEEARRRAAELDATIEAIADGVSIHDPSGRLLRMNPAADELIGYTAAERELPIEARVALMRFETPEGQVVPTEAIPGMRALHGEIVRNVPMVLRRAGRTTWLSISAAPIRGPSGAVLGVVVSYSDITAQYGLQERQEDFIRALSHDLRNPLTVISGQAQWLQRHFGQQDLPRGSRAAQAILRSSRQIAAMVDDLLESVRLESGQMALQLQQVEIAGLVADIAERIGTRDDRARLRVECPRATPPVWADPAYVERAIVNLVSNALKYSAPEKPVRVQVEPGDGEAVITVIDQGVGIPPEELPHLFERFYRARSGRHAEGLGLGLYITRLIVGAHGGRVWAESQAGQGATVHLTLPYAAAVTPAAA
jgi:PAS domain S-box-containing protein